MNNPESLSAIAWSLAPEFAVIFGVAAVLACIFAWYASRHDCPEWLRGAPSMAITMWALQTDLKRYHEHTLELMRDYHNRSQREGK